MSADDVVNRLVAESRIRDVLHLRARATDRVDVELAMACYHPGATEKHDSYSGDAREFVQRRLSNPRADIVIMSHFISNILVDLRSDDSAFVECYYELRFTTTGGGVTNHLVGGRYLDLFERIDGVWAIRHRETVTDFRISQPGEDDGASGDETGLAGRRGGDDPLYAFVDRGAPTV